MVTHLYAISWNEEIIMPYFLRHYSQFCDKMVIFDNESTDSTPDIVKSFPKAELRSWSSNNQLNDMLYLVIKNNAYKESRGIADWVIVCDSDEFLYHPKIVQLLEAYKKIGINFPKVEGFDMIPNATLGPNDVLPDLYKMGMPA